MIRGRRPTPTNLRLLQGNPQKRAIPKGEMNPRIAEDDPEPPSFLKGYAADEWRSASRELRYLGVLAVIDTMTFAAYCQSVARWRLAEEALQRMVDNDKVMNGFIIKRQNGEAGTNPLVTAARRAAVEMLRFASEFGMTPVARARIASGIVGENKVSKFGDLLA